MKEKEKKAQKLPTLEAKKFFSLSFSENFNEQITWFCSSLRSFCCWKPPNWCNKLSPDDTSPNGTSPICKPLHTQAKNLKTWPILSYVINAWMLSREFGWRLKECSSESDFCRLDIFRGTNSSFWFLKKLELHFPEKKLFIFSPIRVSFAFFISALGWD